MKGGEKEAVHNEFMQTIIMQTNVFPVVNSKKTEFSVFEIIVWITLIAVFFCLITKWLSVTV